ncbi:MAG: outer membrane protein assembly factor BamD [Bacteroidota bacterium]
MFKKSGKLLLVFIIGVVLFSSCKYEKLLKSSDYQLKYDKAIEYYKAEDYEHAIGLFEQLNPVLKATNKADTVLYYLADSYFEQTDYILAEHHFKQFHETYGNHIWAEEAEYMRAFCNYKLSPRPQLDQSYTRKAINQFQLFINRHPNSSKAQESREYISKLRDKLAKKAYNSAKLYYDMKDYKAAIVALENCLKRFPNTSHREELRYLILRSKFYLATYSIKDKEKERYQAALDEYYTFENEFPDSEYEEKVESIYEKTQKHLEN